MRIGIIGGSGLENPDLLRDFRELDIETPYGIAKIISGKISEVDVFIISRHGKKHAITPSNVNNRANIYALAKLGCKYVIATTACGSLRDDIKPGDFVILDQLIDFTKFRKTSFHDNFDNGVVHASLADPFSEELRKKLIHECEELGYNFHEKGTVITIEGPRFSTRAESNLFRTWNCDVINMSTAPEASLAREAGMEYAVVAMSTDYDCWKSGEEDVSIELIFSRLKENADKVRKLIINVIDAYSQENRFLEHKKTIKSSIRTIPDFPKPGIQFRDITTLMKDPEALKKAIEILVDKYKGEEIDVIAGIESRGFIFGAILADKLGVRFVPVRKPGKLPAAVERQEYELEYGKDAIEIHKDAISPGDRVLIVDDLLATGGTMQAACQLIEKLQGEVVGCAFVIELPELRGRKKLEGRNVFSIIDFEGE